MKILFMGTPDFAVPTLNKLIESKHEVIGVITQPDKPKGRGKAILCTPVKECAMLHGIDVYQPLRVKNEDFIKVLQSLEFDAIVVIAFGQILSKQILDMPRFGCINVHSSLLPAYRGSAPIQWTIINGEKQTGITTMYMDEGIDTGDILLQRTTDILPEDTGGSLHDRLADIGAELLIKTLADIERGDIIRIKQNESKASYIGMLSKELGKIDFNKGADVIERLIRGLNPWPSAYTKLDDKTLKIWKAKVTDTTHINDRICNKRYVDYLELSDSLQNGTIIMITKDSFIIKTAMDYLECFDIQLEGKKRMTTDAFLRGYELKIGTVLG